MGRIVDKGTSHNNTLDIKKGLMLVIRTLTGHLENKRRCLISIISLEINGPSSQEKWMEGKNILLDRSDNSIKNRFYSRLRKGLKRMNT